MVSRIYAVALSMVPGLGCRGYRTLLDVYPDPQEVFSLSESGLKELFGRHTNIIDTIRSRSLIERAENEVRLAESKKIRILFCGDDDYPQRLNNSSCSDCPPILYVVGKCNLNGYRALGVVGTRRATMHGRETAHRIVCDLGQEQVTIVSGLAYGIDTVAHTAALECGLPTVAVLGHGLDRIYPAANRGLAQRIVENGGCIVTEYTYGTEINAAYFPARNRIIAALSDGTMVVEAAEKGGALITATIAGSYNREVMAVPGRPTDNYSVGCNNLLIEHRASLVCTARDVMRTMGWYDEKKTIGGTQQELFVAVTDAEQKIIDMLVEKDVMTLDELATQTESTLSRMAATMLEMELRGLVKVLPGSRYQAFRR